MLLLIGTWEEKDMTEFSKSRITAMCLEAEVRHSDTKASGSKIRACVTGDTVDQQLMIPYALLFIPSITAIFHLFFLFRLFSTLLCRCE